MHARDFAYEILLVFDYVSIPMVAHKTPVFDGPLSLKLPVKNRMFTGFLTGIALQFLLYHQSYSPFLCLYTVFL